MKASMKPTMAHPFPRIGLTVATLSLLAALALPLVVHNPSMLNLAVLALMAAQVGVAWNIVGGQAGQVSLGHAAFFGIGAYTSTLLSLKLGISPWIGLPAGGLLAALLSVAFGWSCFRLRGHYFAMATIAVAELTQIFFTNWEFAGASVGLNLTMDREGWAWLNFAGKLPYYWLALGLLALTLLAAFCIERSYLGYYFRAIKDEPEAARSIGIDIARYKQVALAVSAFFTALGGGLYAHKEFYIDPGSVLSTALSIKMALVAILGGIGTLSGPVLGALVLTLIEEASRMLFGGTGSGIDIVLYALLIVLIAVFYPAGLVGSIRDMTLRARQRWRRRQAAATAGTAATAAAAEGSRP